MPSSLVFDPDPHRAEKICRLLALMDVAAKQVYTLPALFMVLSEFKPDLIFLSAAQGEENVIEESMARIREDLSPAKTAIVLVAESSAGLITVPAGIVDVITSPVSLEQIEQILIRSGLNS
jgi:CheY-like chemotaxis protein